MANPERQKCPPATPARRGWMESHFLSVRPSIVSGVDDGERSGQRLSSRLRNPSNGRPDGRKAEASWMHGGRTAASGKFGLDGIGIGRPDVSRQRLRRLRLGRRQRRRRRQLGKPPSELLDTEPRTEATLAWRVYQGMDAERDPVRPSRVFGPRTPTRGPVRVMKEEDGEGS